MSWHEILCNRPAQGNETSDCWKVYHHHLLQSKKKKKKLCFIYYQKPYLNSQNLSFCSQLSAKVQGFSFLLKLVPFWAFHKFRQEKKIASGEGDNTWQDMSLTWRGISALCHIANGLFKKWKLSKKWTWRPEGKDGLLSFMRSSGTGHGHVIVLKCWEREFCTKCNML